jgi:hypothetical protein
MDSHNNQTSDRSLSRRQFGMVLGGGVLLLLAGGAYGVVERSPEKATTSAATAFGSLSIVRAGRLARLDARGRPAFKTLAAAASYIDADRGPGSGSVIRRVSSTEDPGLDRHGHDGETLGDRAWPEPVNRTWADVVLLEVQLSNASAAPVLFSPGQLRLRLSPSATTITHRDSDRAPGPLAPRGSERILISYLAPHDSQELELDYSDGQEDKACRLALPPLTMNEARP